MWLVDRARELFARALARRVGNQGSLAEGQLQGTEAVPQRAGVLAADFRSSGRDESGKCGDQLAGLVKVLKVLGIGTLSQSALHSGGAHEVDRGGGDDFDRSYFGDIPDLG